MNASPSVSFLRLVLMLSIFTGSICSLSAQKVSIDFDQFHGLSATSQYLRDVAAAYPEIAEIKQIGTSEMGRPLEVLIITNRSLGTALDRHIGLRNKRSEGIQNVLPQDNHQTKPAQWICGSTHGNEYTGTEVCLYIIDRLSSLYGIDEEVTDLVDSQTFYICPVVNPDGLFNSVDRGIPQRQNSLKKDDDQDGRINEDGPEDMNGDGLMTWFRYKDDKGRYLMHEDDDRIMIRVGADVKTDKQRYSVVLEGVDNDGDGRVNEDPEAGFDLNRNFPEGWFTDDGFQGGTGKYPTSAPETQALAEFFVNHPNIHMAQFFHTSGGFTYRPMGSSNDDSMHPDDIRVYDFVLGKKYVELIGLTVPDAWNYPDSLAFYREKLQETSKNRYAIKRGYALPEGWVVSWNEKSDKRYAYGLQADWAYMQMGVFSLTTELFSYKRDLPGHAFSGKSAWSDYQKAAIRYQEEHFDGRLFHDWAPFNHEEYGEGEIGGWVTLYGSNNPFPGEMLEQICETHWQFEKYRAGLMPRVIIRSATAEVLEKKGKEQIVEIEARFENTGQLPTLSGVGQKLPLSRQDLAWLVGDRDKIEFLQGAPWQRLGFLGGKLQLPGMKSGKSTNEAKWLVRIKGDADLKVVLSSQRGGTVVQDVKFK